MGVIDQHTIRLSVDATSLDTVSASITLDDSWAPYIQATFTVVTPTNVSTIDPRQLRRAQVNVYQQFASYEFVSELSALFAGKSLADVSTQFAGLTLAALTALRVRWNATDIPVSSRSFNLALRSRVINVDGTTTIRLASDEALIQDARTASFELSTGTEFRTAATLREIIVQDLTTADFFDRPLTLTPGAADIAIPTGNTPASPLQRNLYFRAGDTFWDRYQGMIQAGNLRLWCDENRVLRLEPRDQVAPGLASFTALNVLSQTDEINRDSDEWGEQIILEYLPNPADATTQYRAVARFFGITVTKAVHVKINAVTPGTGLILTAAQALIDRIFRRGRVVPVTAVSDYTITPLQPAQINSGGTPLTGIVQSVTWRFPEARMTVVTRKLEE